MKEETEVKIKELIMEQQKKGNVVFATFDGLMFAPLDKFVAQPVEGLLYDLNRLPEVVMTFLPDPKWINDYAVYQVITYLHGRVQELEEAQCSQVKS